jgi:hypothetical protein
MSEIIYQNKYLKYKTKYFNLMNEMYGGADPLQELTKLSYIALDLYKEISLLFVENLRIIQKTRHTFYDINNNLVDINKSRSLLDSKKGDAVAINIDIESKSTVNTRLKENAGLQLKKVRDSDGILSGFSTRQAVITAELDKLRMLLGPPTKASVEKDPPKFQLVVPLVPPEIIKSEFEMNYARGLVNDIIKILENITYEHTRNMKLIESAKLLQDKLTKDIFYEI